MPCIIHYKRPSNDITEVEVLEAGHYNNIQVNANSVTQVIASGEELEYIRKRFANLRDVVTDNGVIYYGDDAKFIVGNWARKEV